MPSVWVRGVGKIDFSLNRKRRATLTSDHWLCFRSTIFPAIPGKKYFADGMTDELTTMLAKNSTLRIVSRTSVMQYKGAHRPLPEIAHELGVDGILEGSVARSGDKVHMTIQLIQAPSDTHIWAESYDRDANDVVSLPTRSCADHRKKINSAVLQPAPQRYVSPEAHDAYLRGQVSLVSRERTRRPANISGKRRNCNRITPSAGRGLAGYYGAGVGVRS